MDSVEKKLKVYISGKKLIINGLEEPHKYTK